MHMFETTKKDLKDIMRDVDNGNLQLPDFQRDYVWGDEDVRSLIASIAKGYPVGALLTLVTGGEVNFKPRLLAGVQEKNVEPEELLLDGQQRITSLYQAMFGKSPPSVPGLRVIRRLNAITTSILRKPSIAMLIWMMPSSEFPLIKLYARISAEILKLTSQRRKPNSNMTCFR